MAENMRIALDLLALAAIFVAVLKGVFNAGADNTILKQQVELHTRWIADHKECNEKQIAILNELRDDLAYLRGMADGQKVPH